MQKKNNKKMQPTL